MILTLEGDASSTEAALGKMEGGLSLPGFPDFPVPTVIEATTTTTEAPRNGSDALAHIFFDTTYRGVEEKDPIVFIDHNHVTFQIRAQYESSEEIIVHWLV